MDLKKGLGLIGGIFEAIGKPRVDDEMSSALRKYEAIGYTCEKKMNDGFTLRLVAASGLRDSSSPKDPIILYMNTSNTIRAVPENQFDPLSQATTQMCPFAFAKCTNVELTELGRIGDRNEAKSYYKKHRNLDGYLCKGCTKQSDVYFQQFQE